MTRLYEKIESAEYCLTALRKELNNDAHRIGRLLSITYSNWEKK